MQLWYKNFIHWTTADLTWRKRKPSSQRDSEQSEFTQRLTLNTHKTSPGDRAPQTFSVKSQVGNIFGFKGHVVQEHTNGHAWVPHNYLWTLNVEFHITFICPQIIFFFWFVSNSLKTVKIILKPWSVQKRQAGAWLGPLAIFEDLSHQHHHQDIWNTNTLGISSTFGIIRPFLWKRWMIQLPSLPKANSEWKRLRYYKITLSCSFLKIKAIFALCSKTGK